MVLEQEVQGEAYYGWGQVMCFSCHKDGITLTKIFEGYEPDSLTQAQIEELREVANGHQRNHNVKIHIFSRGMG